MGIKKKYSGFIAMLVVLTLFFASCGSSNSSSSMDYAAKETAEYEFDGDRESFEAGAMASAAVDDLYDMETNQAADEMEEKSVVSGSGSTEPEDAKAVEPADSNQKLVYTCWMTIQTLEFAETQTAVKEAVKKVGGIIESESVNDSDRKWFYYDEYKRSGTITSDLRIRVPSAKYEEFLGLLDGAGGKITNKSQNVENITKRYNDQTVYIQSLETQEKRLLEMMEKAETVEDMITVESRLTEVQTELNQARSELSVMDTDVKYSTVNLSLVEVVRYEDTPKTPVSFGERIAHAVEDSWSNFVDFLQDFVIWLIYMIPAILLLLVIAVLVFIIRKAWRKKHPKKVREKKQNPNMNGQGRFFGRPRNMNGGSGNPNGMNQGPAGWYGAPNGMNQGPAGWYGAPNGMNQGPAGEHGAPNGMNQGLTGEHGAPNGLSGAATGGDRIPNDAHERPEGLDAETVGPNGNRKNSD